MAQLHIPQTMLILRQLEQFPTIQKAISVFEWVLSQKDLLSMNSFGQSGFNIELTQDKVQPGTDLARGSQDVPMASVATSSEMPFESGQWFEEFLGFDFLDNLALLDG